MKERQSNFELLRILLMCTIPVFHLMVYNGVYYVDNSNALWALVLTVGGAIPADYAFIALSAYFWLEREDEIRFRGVGGVRGFLAQPVIKKFIYLAVLVGTLYIVKVATLRGLFGYNNQEYFIDFFLMKGAWWYIYPYMVMSLIYPFLNKIIKMSSYIVIHIITTALSVIFIYNGLINRTSFIRDLLAFLFVYFFMALLRRRKYTLFCGLTTTKGMMSALIVLIYVSMLVVAVVIKMACIYFCTLNGHDGTMGMGVQSIFDCIRDLQNINVTDATSQGIINFIIGRYHLLSMIMGLAIFFLFRDINIKYNPRINKYAKTTIYIFLLHDTWMGVFWYFGICWNDYGYYPIWSFFGWMIIYVGSAFALAPVLAWIYNHTVKKLATFVIEGLLGEARVEKC